MPRFCSFSPLKWHWMHPILKTSRKILTSKYYDKFAFIQIRDSMGAHLIFFIIFTLFSSIILTNQSLPWYSLQSGFQCDTNMAAVFSGMRPSGALWPIHWFFSISFLLFIKFPDFSWYGSGITAYRTCFFLLSLFDQRVHQGSPWSSSAIHEG